MNHAGDYPEPEGRILGCPCPSADEPRLSARLPMHFLGLHLRGPTSPGVYSGSLGCHSVGPSRGFRASDPVGIGTPLPGFRCCCPIFPMGRARPVGALLLSGELPTAAGIFCARALDETPRINQPRFRFAAGFVSRGRCLETEFQFADNEWRRSGISRLPGLHSRHLQLWKSFPTPDPR